MRPGNASWIKEARNKAKRNDKCLFLMTLVYILGLKMLRSMFIYMTKVCLILAKKLN